MIISRLRKEREREQELSSSSSEDCFHCSSQESLKSYNCTGKATIDTNNPVREGLTINILFVSLEF